MSKIREFAVRLSTGKVSILRTVPLLRLILQRTRVSVQTVFPRLGVMLLQQHLFTPCGGPQTLNAGSRETCRLGCFKDVISSREHWGLQRTQGGNLMQASALRNPRRYVEIPKPALKVTRRACWGSTLDASENHLTYTANIRFTCMEFSKCLLL